MFVRNGQALGSVLHSAAPKARPKPKPKTVTEQVAALKETEGSVDRVQDTYRDFFTSEAKPDKSAEPRKRGRPRKDTQKEEVTDGDNTAGP